LKYIYRNGSEHGKWEKYYENGEIKLHETYLNGKKDGIWKYFYEDGKLKWRRSYNEGIKSGTWKTYHENTNLNLTETYTKYGKLDGVRTKHYKNGKLEFEEFYKEGKKDDIWKYFYESGKIEEEKSYKENRRNGVWKTYHENGNMNFIENYKDGKLNDIRKRHYENGKIKLLETYTNGTLNGTKTSYHKNGKVKYKEYYDNGQLIDTQRSRLFVPALIHHKGVKYKTVLSPITNRIWLDRNIGASKVCSKFDDTDCYGYFYPWSNEWNKIDGSSICPRSFRVPNINELMKEEESVALAKFNFKSFLRIPSSGLRDSSGMVLFDGTHGYLWSSSSYEYNNIAFGSNLTVKRDEYFRRKKAGSLQSRGYPVRCIKTNKS